MEIGLTIFFRQLKIVILKMMRPETFRQYLILVGMGLCYLMESFILGHGVSMVAALYAEKEELHLTDEIISWIIATVFTPMVFGNIAATLVTEKFGRRVTLSAFNIPVIFYWVLLHYTRDGTVFILGRLLAGFCFGGTIPTIYMTVAEYSAPNKRGSNFAVISAMGPVGGMLGQFLGLAYHWRTACLIAIVPAVFAALMPVFYVESPQWLASKGRFKDCETAFRALHGFNSEKELQLLLEVEKCKLENNTTKAQLILDLARKLKFAATKRYFWNVMILGYIIQFYKIFCGFMLRGILGVTILQHVTGQKDVLKFTLLCDGLMLFGCIVANIILSKFRTRVLVFTGGFLNNIVLIVFSIVLYFNASNEGIYPWIKTFLIGVHYFVLNATAYPLLEMLPQEMYPLEIKTVCTTIITFFSTMTIVIYTKTIPGLFVQLEYYGVYMVHVLIMFFCLLFFWIQLPETKGRTLQEIELFFKNGKFENIDDLLKSDQIKVLV